GIIFRQRLVRGSSQVFFRLARLRVDVYDFHVARPRTGSDLLEDKLLGVRYLQQRQVFRWRTDEYQVIVLGVVQREETAAFDPKALVQLTEDIVERMHSQNLAHSGVMVQDHCVQVPGAIVVTHTSVRAPDKGSIAEDDPGLLWAGEKALPEDSEGHGH